MSSLKAGKVRVAGWDQQTEYLDCVETKWQNRGSFEAEVYGISVPSVQEKWESDPGLFFNSALAALMGIGF